MTDLFDPKDDRASACTDAARSLLPLFSGDTKLSRRDLNDAMVAAYGGTDADGCWTQRDSFEVLEHALALHLVSSAPALQSPADIQFALDLLDRLPTQTVRSEDQIDWQQFSTPVDIAAVVVLLAAAQPTDVVLEPSAGNGLLVAQLPRVAALHLNEIDPARRARLAASFPGAEVSGHDGAAIGSTMTNLPRPSLILMNPPFSRSVGRGSDALAAVRHLQAALKRLLPGGRLVAVMPDWFANSARMADIWAMTFAGMALRTSIRLTNGYGKHGTGVSVRLYVIDKAVGDTTTVTISRRNVGELIEALIVPKRGSPQIEALGTPVKRGGAVSLLRAMKSRPAVAPRIFRAPTRNEVLPVGYQVLETPAPIAEQVGVYLPYRPSRIVFEAAGEHPTSLVESVAMGSIPAPIPSHIPHLPERTVSERLLSSSQLETVVYAGHAWTQFIPGMFTCDKEGVGLVLDAAGRQYRKGFFLGDGTGAGKGRQVAAIILDNWLAGRRKAIWVSKNAPGGKPLSARLHDELAVQRRDILAASILADPALALDYMLFAMADQGRSYSRYGTTITAGRPQDPQMPKDQPATQAQLAIGEAREALVSDWTTAASPVERFEAFRALDDDAKASWLAVTVASSLEAKPDYSSAKTNPLHGRLASILEIDVAKWWRPTSANFFDRVSKGTLLALLTEVGGPVLAARYVGSKKGEISTSCEKLFAGEAITEAETKEAALAWVPDAMRFDAVSSLGDADIDETLDDEDAGDAEGGLTSDDPLEELADHGHDDHEDALEPVNDDATLIAAE